MLSSPALCVKTVPYLIGILVRKINFSVSLPCEFNNVKIVLQTKELNAKERAKRAKRLQWENEALFGPLLKRNQGKRKEIMIGKLEIGNDVVNTQSLTCNQENLKLEYSHKVIDNCDIKEDFVLNEQVSSLNNYHNTDFPMMNPWRGIKTKIFSEALATEAAAQTKTIYPSVTKILNETMPEASRKNLERWKSSMIERLGEEGFARYQADLFQHGKDLHSCIAELLQGTDKSKINIMPANTGHWKSLEHIFPKIQEVALLEKPICHPHLQYKGIVDCVAVYRNKMLVIDWKTSKKIKSSIFSTFDNPLQVVAYLGAVNFDPKLNLKVDTAAIVVAYEDGNPAHIHLMDRIMCLNYWKKWLKRLNQFRSLSLSSSF